MVELEKEELQSMIGGGEFALSGAVLNAFKSMIDALFEVGKHLGASIRRIGDAKMCPIK